jgi:hypothetical protein
MTGDPPFIARHRQAMLQWAQYSHRSKDFLEHKNEELDLWRYFLFFTSEEIRRFRMELAENLINAMVSAAELSQDPSQMPSESEVDPNYPRTVLSKDAIPKLKID